MQYSFLLLAYLLGSIPFALVVGKMVYQTDIRQHGSGNLGGTNAFRVLGAKAGIVVILGDILKGTLAASLPALLHLDVNPLLFGLAAILGHCFPVFAQFKGGKAVATSGGVLLFLSPVLFASAISVMALTLVLFRMVSLSSILTAWYIVFYSAVFSTHELVAVFTVFALLITYRHRHNLTRIRSGQEPKVTLFKKKRS